MNLLCKPLTLSESSQLYRHLNQEIDHWKVGQDGCYCLGDDTWFELDGKTYQLHRREEKARAQFKNELVVNDEAILLPREVVALNTLLNTLRKGELKKALQKRLQLHYAALELRAAYRRGMASFYRVRKKAEALKRKHDVKNNP